VVGRDAVSTPSRRHRGFYAKQACDVPGVPAPHGPNDASSTLTLRMKLARPYGVTPGAAALLASVLYLLAALIVLQVGGCLQAPPVNTGPVQTFIPGQRTPKEQEAYTIKLTVLCISEDDDNDKAGIYVFAGTGVLLDSTHVVTAGHMTNHCAGDEMVILGRTVWGTGVWLQLDKRDMHADLARLSTVGGTKISVGYYAAAPAHIGPRPLHGDDVCFESAVPDRSRHCSKVISRDAIPRLVPDDLDHSWWNSDVYIDGLVVHGNSGSGVYDVAGNLIGIITELDPDNDTGGRFTSLSAHPDITEQ
jgi:hypothetical protein